MPVSESGRGAAREYAVVIRGGRVVDPSQDLDAARDLVASTADAALYLYPGKEHLFADSSLPSYDGEAAALLTQRVLDFLAPMR